MQRIGSDALLDAIPTRVTADGKPYILNRDSDGEVVLYSAICPHQGSTVEVETADCFTCPNHGWEFDPETGESTTAPGQSLDDITVKRREGDLYADFGTDEETITLTTNSNPEPPAVTVVSHATLLIEWDDFRLLTDPWLDGPAFLGGWTQYPPPRHEIADLPDVDAIWLTHEHSDHFHENTLSQLDSSTPVYVAELDYRRMSSRLSDLGFESVHSMPAGDVYDLHDGVEAVCFESEGAFFNTVQLFNFGGFKFLNLNDTGVHWEVKDRIGQVDLVSVQFSNTASGYPLTWNHISDGEKKRILREQNRGALAMCEEIYEMYEPEYFLPFSKFFEIYPPEHEPYRAVLNSSRNTPADVKETLREYPVEVLDLIPGESWDEQAGGITRRPDRGRFFDVEFKESYLAETYTLEDWVRPDSFDISHEELRSYFESFSGTPLAAGVGDHAFSMNLTSEARTLHALVRFTDGDVRYSAHDSPVQFDAVDADTHVIMRCDGTLVQKVVRENRSWDEVHIGFWCEFDREPDEYNMDFWKLLHAPWKASQDSPPVVTPRGYDTDLCEMAIADLLEGHDQAVRDVFEEYGLYCVGCPASIGENVVEGARIHGLSDAQTESLVDALERKIVDSPADAD